jgi:hypothetical protein
MSANVIAAMRTALQGPHGKGVTKRVQLWNRLSGSMVDANTLYERTKRPFDREVLEPVSVLIHEDVIVPTPKAPSPSEVTLEAGRGRFVQRDKAGFAELGLADDQSVGCDVVESQGEGLGNA